MPQINTTQRGLGIMFILQGGIQGAEILADNVCEVSTIGGNTLCSSIKVSTIGMQ